MIYSGEFRLHLLLISKILKQDYRSMVFLNKTIIDINNSNINFDSSRVVMYKKSASSSVRQLTNDKNAGDIIKLNYLREIYGLVQEQYEISIDKFLEENYIEIPLTLKTVSEFIGVVTTRYGDKWCRFIDLDIPISELENSKYSNKKMTWSFLGGFNSPWSADFN
jgi:hypothetical protein